VGGFTRSFPRGTILGRHDSLTATPEENSAIMAVVADMQQLELHVQGCSAGSFTWLVRGQPVVAVFPTVSDGVLEHALDHTGQPSPHNAVPHDLLLWVGLDQAASRLLLTLTQRIRVSSKRKSRLMFLIVPVETLTLEVHKPTLWNHDEENLPLALYDAPAGVASTQASRLLKMTFSLGTKCKSRVAMPVLRYAEDVSRQSLLLLRKLKALSEASQFDLFTNHNSWTQQGLMRVQSLLQMSCLVTPILDLKNLYPGSRDGSWDRWEDQGWHDRDESDLEKAKPAILWTKKHRRGRGTAQQVYKRHKQSSPSPSTKPPPYQDMRSSPAILSSPVHHENLATHVGCHGGSLPKHRAMLELTGEVPVVLQSDYESTTVLDPLEIAGPDVTHNDLPAITSSCRQSPLPSSLSQGAEGCSTGSDLFSVVPGTPIGSSVMSLADHRDSSVLSTDTEFCLLMPHLWSLCPDVHFIFIVELLKLGSASKANAKEFREIRVAFMNTLLSYVVTNRSSVATPRPAILTRLDSEIPSLLTWLSILDPTADMLVLSSLVRMAELKQQLVQLGTVVATDAEMYLGLVRMFQQIKSVVVTTTCMSFGDRVLSGDKNIAVKMLQARQLTSSHAD
jgi:hypothetical protein